MDHGKKYFDRALLNYVQNGSIKVLESFFQNKIPSDVTDELGRTLLHYAAESNNVSMTQHFMDKNYNLDVIDNNGDTPIMLAVARDSVDTVKLLIKANANIYSRDAQGRSILPDKSQYKYKNRIYRMAQGDWQKKYRELVKIILEKVRKDFWNNEQLFVSRLRDIDCSLIKAIYLKDANVTRLMLNNGWSVGERDPETMETALHEAVKLVDLENVKVLLEYGADIGARDNDGWPPLYACNDYHSNNTEEKIKILKILLDHGALQIRPPEKTCMTPHNYILQNGTLWAIKTLMQYNFEWDNECSLWAMVSNRNPDVLEALRGKKIDVNSLDNPMRSPILSCAATYGHLRKVQFLLESGADPNLVGINGHTPFISAFTCIIKLKKEHIPIVHLLLQYGANAQYSFRDTQTVFDVAIYNDNEILLEPVIAHLAMMESVGETITDLIRRKINSKNKFKVQYDKCKQQLDRAMNTTVYESVTIHRLLTKSQQKILSYSRNHEFVDKFKRMMENERLSLDPYYLNSLRRRVGKAIHITRLKEEAVTIMSKLFGSRIKTYHEILYEIVEYLNCDDLKNINNVFSLQESEPFHLNTLFV